MTGDPGGTTARGLPRPAEALAALVALAAAAPLLAVLAVAIRVTSPGPALFRQLRVGRDGHPFELLKLRTMRQSAGSAVTAAGDRRVTPVGRLLRRTKLDELPGLWNVVRGELSLVGPRPEVPRHVDPADPRWRRVLAVRPGLTHPVTLALRDEEALLAAAAGGDPGEADVDTVYEALLLPYKLDGYSDYETRRSVWSDLRVLADTLLAVIGLARPPSPTVAELRDRR